MADNLESSTVNVEVKRDGENGVAWPGQPDFGVHRPPITSDDPLSDYTDINSVTLTTVCYFAFCTFKRFAIVV